MSEPINRSVTLGTKKYAHNFLAENVEVKLREEGVKTKEFARPGAGGEAAVWRGVGAESVCVGSAGVEAGASSSGLLRKVQQLTGVGGVAWWCGSEQLVHAPQVPRRWGGGAARTQGQEEVRRHGQAGQSPQACMSWSGGAS